MAEALRLIAAVAGAVVVLAVTTTVVGVLLVPRGRVSRLYRAQDTAVAWAFRLLTRHLEYARRDPVLAAQAPVLLLTQLVTWVAALGVGYALLLAPSAPSAMEAAREAASSMLTLGFTSTHGAWPTAVDSAAALTGLAVIALQIAYLPTLYGAYNRRETEVTLLQARAGEPPWGPELLARTHYGVLGVDLSTFYAGWERWAADLAESHVSYPVLLRFRSPRPFTSWVVAMLAVLDAAAMQLAVAPSRPGVQARLCLRMGFVCLRRLATTVGLAVDDDPRPDGPLELTFEEFAHAYDLLVRVGYPVERTAAEAWPDFRGWRVNYEPAAYALARELDAVPARWAGPRRSGEDPITPVRPPNRTPAAPDDPGAGRPFRTPQLRVRPGSPPDDEPSP